jgi:histone acetyltransferase HTATIP
LYPTIRTNTAADSQQESETHSIRLPETEQVVSVLLDEIYGVYNPTTGSIFTNFALRLSDEKEHMMHDLVALFITSDKVRTATRPPAAERTLIPAQYNLESIKQKVVKAIIDRLPFVHDPLSLVDLAAAVYNEQCPLTDRGLRTSILAHVQVRMPSIVRHERAWTEYTRNEKLLKAYHLLQCEALLDAGPSVALSTPPTTPTAGNKRKKV